MERDAPKLEFSLGAQPHDQVSPPASEGSRTPPLHEDQAMHCVSINIVFVQLFDVF
jgi:hypothetical protein